MSSDNVSALHTGHRARLKKRFAKAPDAMEDYEVLELLLGYVLLRKDTKPLAKNLLQRFGSLRGVLDARQEELETVPGFGAGLAIYWKLLRQVLARYEEAPVREREVWGSVEAVAKMARKRLAGHTHEECWLALVDTQNRLISWECLAQGGLNQANFEPREVIERALKRRASGFIIVHNHPGGDTTPSTPDMLTTQMLQRMAATMHVRFLDHVIVSEVECRSLVKDKLL